MSIEIFAVLGLPIIHSGDDLPFLVIKAIEKEGGLILEGDVVVLCHVIVSRSEGNIVDLRTIQPSYAARNFAEFTGKDPRLVEVILRESRAIRRMAPDVLVTETLQGFVCANSGVDKSNVPGDEVVSPLPKDPDVSARKIRDRFKELGVDVAVIIADTHGRAHRDGEVNVAIGASGIDVIRDRRGEKDLFGYELKVKRTAIADELAAAAELVIGQADEGVPVAVIRGYRYNKSEESNARQLVRPREKDLFI
ncbi:MAG: coenzyme F420-0:L-glutamate ligase [Candidatus Bathyarchaeota archaeon]|nr:coenzyme F420-0:L-glutamate ligase [Candidatus Bathyarchaeota archaeon]